MATQAYQQAILIKLKNNTGKGLWIAAKTGYINVVIGNTQYYYNGLSAVNWAGAFQPSGGKKGVIVIKKK